MLDPHGATRLSFESAHFDAIVLGGGAAGLMCAREIGLAGRSALVIEHNREVGRKILISGGGRCNFTNLNTTAANFLSKNLHFAKSALARYGPADFVALVEKHGIAYHEKTLGQLFCDGSARQIVDMLRLECDAGGVRIEAGCRVVDVRFPGPGFAVETAGGTFSAPALVVATGGLSIPKMGASGFGYELARKFEIPVVECQPALVPLVLSPPQKRLWCDLSGVAAEVVAKASGPAFREKMLITHRGLSGPAILQASSYWRAGEPVSIDLGPGVDIAGLLLERKGQGERGLVKHVLAEFLPKRLAERWVEVHGPARVVRDTSDREIAALAQGLHAWLVTPEGTEGFEKAEVTVGGVDTAALSSQTMESARVPGLYFIGEVVDVTGQLGGYNFQWAWASGVCAGRAIADAAKA